MDTKKKALEGISGFLDDRMSDRMKPKAVAVEVSAPSSGDEAHENPDEEKAEGPAVEKQEEGLEQKVEQIGGDLSKLSPDEQSQLEQLYHKMGC